MPDIPTRRWAYPQDNLFHDGVPRRSALTKRPSGPLDRVAVSVELRVVENANEHRSVARLRSLQSKLAQPGMIVRPGPERPTIFALALGDRQVVDAGDAPAHQAVLGEFPIFVPIGAEPVAAVVVPFIGEANRDAVAGEGPDFFDQPVIEFARPFALEERDDFRTAGEELGAVSPHAVLGVGERHALGLASIPRIFGSPRLARGGLGGERRQRRTGRHERAIAGSTGWDIVYRDGRN